MASSSSQRSSSSARSRSVGGRQDPAERLRGRGPAREGRLAGPAGAGRGGGRGGVPVPAVVAAAVAGVAALAVVALLVLSHLPVFVIQSIDAQASEHIDAETIARLAEVEEGTTLLNVDAGQIEQNVRRNPWCASVRITREFPDRLGIEVVEREVGAVVLMGSGDVAWCLGADGVWIEPVQLDTSTTRTAEDVAMARATELGCLLITDVPSSVSPKAGSEATDDTILAVMSYLDGFSDEFRSQISSFSAPSVDAVSCTLANGVEVSLGAPNDIGAKESVVTQILADHPNQVTYVNVRVPSSPSYRAVGAENVQAGSGARVLEDDEGAAGDDASSGDGGDGSGDEAGSDGSEGSDDGAPTGDDGSGEGSEDDGDASPDDGSSSGGDSSGGSGVEIDPSLAAGVRTNFLHFSAGKAGASVPT